MKQMAIAELNLKMFTYHFHISTIDLLALLRIYVWIVLQESVFLLGSI